MQLIFSGPAGKSHFLVDGIVRLFSKLCFVLFLLLMFCANHAAFAQAGSTAPVYTTSETGWPADGFTITNSYGFASQAAAYAACSSFVVSVNPAYVPANTCVFGTSSNGMGAYAAGWLCTYVANQTCYGPSFYEADYFCPEGTMYFSDKQGCVNVEAYTPPYAAKPLNIGVCPVCDLIRLLFGDPINGGTGNSTQTQTDMAVAEPLSGLQITRTYNSSPYYSQGSVTSSFGTRWIQPYDVSLTFSASSVSTAPEFYTQGQCWQRMDNLYIWCEGVPPDSMRTGTITTPASVFLTRSDGRGLYFIQSGTNTGTWVADAGSSGQLTETVSNGAPAGWTYTDPDTHTETFDTNGVLLTMTALGGSTQQLTYSTGTSNDSSVSRYPATAPVCSHVQAGVIVASGSLLCVTDQWGRQLQFEHDTAGRVSKAIDPNNQITQYAYDGPSDGCISTAATPAACSAGNLTSVTYPDGKVKTLYYNEAAQINGGTTCPSTNPVGNGYGYLLNALTGIVDENSNRSVTWTFNCAGSATSSSSGQGVDAWQISIGTPDAYGNVTSVVTSPLGTQQTYNFSAINGWIKAGSVSQPAANGSPAATATSSYDSNGNQTSHTDFNGNITNFTYDTTRNLELTRVEAYGTPQVRTTTTVWSPTFYLPLQKAEPMKLTTYVYDANGNLLTKTQQSTSDASGSQGLSATVTGTPRTWTYTYNSVGQVLTIVGPRTDLVDKTQFTYDSYGNLATVKNALNQVTTLSNYDLNGHAGQITDANGLITSYQYSPRGWLTSQVRGSEVTSYNYDGVGQLVGVTFPNKASLTYTYDTAHRLTNISDNMGNVVNYTLDAMGNRIQEQVSDNNGNLNRQISRVVDVLNRLQQITGAQ